MRRARSKETHGAWLVLGALLLALASHASAATAYWTGQQRYAPTMTGAPGVACQYNYAGRLFWQTFAGSTCPLSVEVS